jgi:uncharacterized DUF497 family protein
VAGVAPLENYIGFDGTMPISIRTANGTKLLPGEAKTCFFHEPLVVRSDIRHAKTEKRYYALGQTTAGSLLFVVFSVRRHIRVISAWNMNRNETNSYKRMKKKLPKFKDEDNERKFWATADSTEYGTGDLEKRKKLVRLKPSLRTISLRLSVAISRI